MRAAEAPPLARGEAPGGLLAPEEAEVLAGLAFPARRRKWLLGRLAAKRLLVEVLAEHGRRVAPAEIVVVNAASGAPSALVRGAPLGWPISISHRDDLGLCAVGLPPAVRLGADLELVEPRTPGLVRDFFTESEAEEVHAREGRERDLAVARIWSAKEAVLKALGLGLRLDTRRIRVAGAGEGAQADDDLRPLQVALDEGLLPAGEVLRAGWRDEGRTVLTFAWTTRV